MTLVIVVCWIVGAILTWFYTSFKPITYPIEKMAGFNGSALHTYLATLQLPDMLVFTPATFGLGLINFVP